MMRKRECLMIAVAAIDQLIKAYVRTLPLGVVFFEIPGVLSLTHCVNTGAAFSIMTGYTAVLSIVSSGLLLGIGYFAAKRLRMTALARTSIAFLIGGGLGNLIDRLLLEGVTDYICLLFINFPVFNFADMAITGSIAVLLFLLLTDRLEEPTEEEHGSKD